MPTRVARYRELCRVCGEQTDEACYRCKTPLCHAHLPRQADRCGSCEAEFRRWPSREPKVLACGALLVTSWVLFTLALLNISPTAAILWALIFPMLAGLGAHRALVSGRKIFLDQEKRAKMISDGRQIMH